MCDNCKVAEIAAMTFQAQMEAIQEAQQFKAPTLRKSTRERIEEAEKERQRAEQVRPKLP